MKKFAFLFLLITLKMSFIINAQLIQRLATKTYTTPNFLVVTKYHYDSIGTIKEIINTQNGKFFYRIFDFEFNEKLQLVQYKKTSDIKKPKEVIDITYNNTNQILYYEITKSNNIIKKLQYHYNYDTVMVTTPNNKSIVQYYIYDNNNNIVTHKKKYIIGQPIINNFSNYDLTKNPSLLTGGYIDETLTSKNNYTLQNDNTKNRIFKKLDYQKILVTTHKIGEAKIPTQYKNGLLLKETETRVDNNTNKETIISTTNFEYINL